MASTRAIAGPMWWKRCEVMGRDGEEPCAETGAGESGDAAHVEPASEDLEEASDTSGGREIPIGTPEPTDSYRQAKQRADISSADAQADPSVDEVDLNE